MRIYFDTNLWNMSYDRNVRPAVLLEALDRLGCTPVLGMHVIFELLKTFSGADERSKDRGTQLFSHIAEYLHAGLRCIAKQPSDMLAAEMWSSKGTHATEKFLSSDDVGKVTSEVDRLKEGAIKSEWFSHIETQRAVSQDDRNRQQAFSQSEVSTNDVLRRVAPEEFNAWLNENTNTQLGRDALTQQLTWQFPEESRMNLAQYSNFLLQNNCRVAHAMVRSIFYYNWRCVHRGSNPSDLLDDMYHILSASYCDIYATEDAKQEVYAALLLSRHTQTQIYQRGEPFEDWFVRLATRLSR